MNAKERRERLLTRSSRDPIREQRASAEQWSEIIDMCEKYKILPIDALATIHDLCKEQIEERMELLFGHRKGITIKLN